MPTNTNPHHAAADKRLGRTKFYTYIGWIGNGRFYVGHTARLQKRLREHRLRIPDFRYLAVVETRTRPIAFGLELALYRAMKKDGWIVTMTYSKGKGRRVS